MTSTKINSLISKDPSLMFSIVKVECEQTQPGSLLASSGRGPGGGGGSKMRDPGNKVGYYFVMCKIYSVRKDFSTAR